MSSHNATRLKAGLEEDNESPLGEATRCESFEAALGQDPMWAVLWLIPGSMAFKEAARKAKPVLLEPVMAVEVTVPDEYMGTIIGDLNSRRGRIEGMEMVGGVQAIKATVPLSNMFGYATAIRCSTRPSPAPKPPPSCRSSTRSWASPLGRSTSGVRLLNLESDDRVGSATVIPLEDPQNQRRKRHVGAVTQLPQLCANGFTWVSCVSRIVPTMRRMNYLNAMPNIS